MSENNEKMEYVSIGTLELHEDRNTEEKNEMRKEFAKRESDLTKHFHRIIACICVSFLIAIISIFGFLFYVLYNFDFASYSQDGNGINNILGRSAQQGDLSYEPETDNNEAQEIPTERNSDKP